MHTDKLLFRNLFVLFIMLFVPVAQMHAGNKSDQKELLRAVARMLQMEEATKASVPDFLLHDEAASYYCGSVLYHPEEQYSQDTARANKLISDARWILDHQVYPDEKMTKKLTKQKYDVSKLRDIYDWAVMVVQNAEPRYSILTRFCDQQFERRRNALKKTMPSGQLLRFSYEEYGSSAPRPNGCVLERDGGSGRWLLNGYEVPDSVAAEVRGLAEEQRVYQCMDYYDEPPSFPQFPHQLGGPPAWRFRCEFEGGTISTGSESELLPDGCAKIVGYLKDLLYQLWKNQPERY